jgi:hypothetical protein
MVRKGDTPTVQCEMNLTWSNSVREVDGPNSVFLDFKVPALAPYLNYIQIALQLSGNITLFAIRDIRVGVISEEGQINA